MKFTNARQNGESMTARIDDAPIAPPKDVKGTHAALTAFLKKRGLTKTRLRGVAIPRPPTH